MEEAQFKFIPIKKRGVETGEFAKCSPKHYDILMNYNWYIDKFTGYVTTSNSEQKITMHKYVMTVIEKIEIPEGYVIDHIDTTDPNNKLNNSLDNLRLFTTAQNGRNKRKKENCLSNLIGVVYNKKAKKYQSAITLNSNSIYLGLFDTEIEAGMFRDAYIVQNNLIKEGYPLNFKDKEEELVKYNIKRKQKASKFKNVGKMYNYYYARICINKKEIFHYKSKNEIECAKQ